LFLILKKTKLHFFTVMPKGLSLVYLNIFYCCLLFSNCQQNKYADSAGSAINLPERGLCAHRGAMGTHPENTLPAFHAAVDAGAHMIEFDVQMTGDGKLVVIHDLSVDRTTDGTGPVAGMKLDDIRKLDAGSWKGPGFEGVRIPLLEEVLDIMPVNIWLNIHLKGGDILGELVARKLAEHDRLHQSFLACGAGPAARARQAVPSIKICNMDRRENNIDYVFGTIDMNADFIQLRGPVYAGFAGYCETLKQMGIRINYFGTDDPDELKLLFDYGVDFPLVDDIVNTIDFLPEFNILPVKALYRESQP
jgi:glycerophosphoryl diester phosphodiesterase